MSLFKSLMQNDEIADEYVPNEEPLKNNLGVHKTDYAKAKPEKIQLIDKEDFGNHSDTEFSEESEDDKCGDESADEDLSNHFGSFLLGFGDYDASDINKEIKRKFKIVDKRLKNWVGDCDVEDLSQPTPSTTTERTWMSENKKDDTPNSDVDDVEEFIKLNKELFGVTEDELEDKEVKVNYRKQRKDTTSIMNTVFSSIKSYKTAGKKCPQSSLKP